MYFNDFSYSVECYDDSSYSVIKLNDLHVPSIEKKVKKGI